MSNAYTTSHLKEVFSFPFNDERWKEKILITVGLTLVSFLILPYFFVSGYLYEIMRRIIVDRKEPSLPEWDDWGIYFTNGFKLFAMAMIYSLPSMALMFGSQLVFFVSMSIAEGSSSAETWLPLISMPIFYGAMGIGMVLMFVTMLGIVVGMGNMIAKDEFGAAFRFKEMWPIFRKNLAGYLIAFVIIMGLYWVTTMVAQVLMLTVVLCCLYPVALMLAQIYFMLVGSVLFAQAYVEGADAVVSDSEAAKELVEDAIEEASQEKPEEDPPAK